MRNKVAIIGYVVVRCRALITKKKYSQLWEIKFMRYEVKITRYKYTIRKNKVANKRNSHNYKT